MNAAIKLPTVRQVLTSPDRSWIKSGLRPYTIFTFRTSDRLERDGDGAPVYMHRSFCKHKCGGRCDGIHGKMIARDVDALEGKFRPRKPRQKRLRPTMREWVMFKYKRESGIREIFYRWTDDIRPEAMVKSWGYVYWENGGEKYCAHG